MNGTATDTDGNYSISVPKNATLIFSSIGYINQEVAVEGRTVATVLLALDTENLEDAVIAIAYGAAKRSSLTGVQVNNTYGGQDASVQDLLTEVKLYRRIDLWGEGFDYYDYKHWNEPIVRKSKANGGSFHSTFAVTINPQDGNKWTWVIPRNETQYNDQL